MIRSQAVQIAIGINEEGLWQILAVALANRESRTRWKDILLELKGRGLQGVEIVVSDDHPAETHEGWLDASRYLNMDLLKEHKKLKLSLAA